MNKVKDVKDGEKNNESIEHQKLLLSFERFKIDVQNIIKSEMEGLHNKIEKKWSELKYWGIGGGVAGFVLITGLFSFLFDFINNNYNSRFDKLEQVTFAPSNQILLNEIRNMIKEQISNRNQSGSLDIKPFEKSPRNIFPNNLRQAVGEGKPRKPNRKPNSDDRGLSSEKNSGPDK